MRFRLRHAAALLALLAGKGVASPRFGPTASDRIPAGRVEVVTLEPAAAGVEERELLLSLDGGRSFPLRLTARIGPGDRQAAWRVPALPTPHAVLALREGGDGREEEIVAVSSEFTIHPGPGLPMEELRFRDGEWKTREADDGRSALPGPSLRGADPDRCEALIFSSDPREEPARASLRAPHPPSKAISSPASADPGGTAPPPRGSSVSLPLRE